MIDELDSPTREPGDDSPLREGNGQPMHAQVESTGTAGVSSDESREAEKGAVESGFGELEIGESDGAELEVGEAEAGELEVGAAPGGDDGPTATADDGPTATADDRHVADRVDVDRDAAGATDGPAQADDSQVAAEPTIEAEASPPAPPAKPKKARTPGKPVEEAPLEEPGKKEWFILKVQSNREDSIADALQRRIAIAGLERFFDEIIVPVEKVSEFKNGKKRVVKRKIYPGYIVVHMELNDDTWFLVRETPGIGDFTGSGGKPTPMSASDVNKIVSKQEEKAEEQITVDVRYKSGDRVRINEGTFENFEGDVDSIDAVNGRVTVMINIFGRSTPVELETWQVETL